MRCHLPWTQAFISANGVVAPCCAPLELGNIADRGVAEVFAGDQYRALQEDLVARRQTSATRHCDNCYALRKYIESGYTFDAAHSVGADTEASLSAMEDSHPGFVSNYRLVRDAYMLGKPLPPQARPLRLEVQLGEHCDIRCIMCWQDHQRPRALRKESYEELGDLLPYAQDVLFTGGEPTIFKNFWQLVERFRASANPEARLQFLTHGQHLKENLHRFEGIPHVGFCVNVDGPTRETYEKIRSGSNWDKLNESLQAVAEARKTQPGWGLNMTFLLMRSNIELIEDSIAMADRYDAQWSCGMLAGEYTPVAQCRTYFEENLFRFDHLGYSKDAIVRRLEAALPAARRHRYALAASNIEATIQQVRQTRQMHVPEARAAEMRAMASNNELSRAILEIVREEARQARPSVRRLHDELDNARQLTGSHSELSALAAMSLALRLMDDGDLSEARTLLEEAVAALRQLNDSDDLDIATARFHLGRCLAMQGDGDAAGHLREAWTTMTGLLGRHNTQSAEAALELGKVLNRAGLFQDAAMALEYAYGTYLAAYGKQEDSSYVAVAANELGVAYLGAGQFADAEKPLRKAVQMHEKLLGLEHSVTGVAAHQLARVLARAGRPGEAVALMRRYLVHYERVLDRKHVLTRMTGACLAEVGGEREPEAEDTPVPGVLKRAGNMLSTMLGR